MNSIVVTSTKQNIKFGYEGENNVTKIIFPYDESWLEYGEGNFEVRILRCGDEVAYTATDVVDDRQAMTLTMTITDIELSVRGRGEMQLCYVCQDSIKKSPIYQYTVNRSIDYKYAINPPEGSIIASVEKSLSEIKNTTNRLSNSVISIESSIDDVNSQIDNINDKISEFDEEIDSISDLNESVTELENRKVTDLETSGGKSDSGKYLIVGTDGKIKATSLTIPPTITVDESLSTTSQNPVQNKVIKTELNSINNNIETCNTEISKINGSLDEITEDSGSTETYVTIPYFIKDFSRTEYGITAVQSSIGRITLSGTATASVSFPIKDSNGDNLSFNLKANETYRLSGCPTGGGMSSFEWDLRTTIVGQIATNDVGSGRLFKPTADGTYYMHVRVASGYTANNVVISPKLEKLTVGVGITAIDKIARRAVEDIVLPDVTVVKSPGNDIPHVTTNYAMAINNEPGQVSRVWYEVREGEEFDGILRTDGKYMFPMTGQGSLPTSNAPYYKIMRVIKTYVGNSNLVYGNYHTMGDDECTNEIDCSTFVTAVLNGITYKNSRHVLGSNQHNVYDDEPGDTLMRYEAIPGWRRLVTQQMAQWFARRGKLFRLPLNIEKAVSMLQFGDVLFSGYDNLSVKPYYQIGHCQLVLGTFPKSGHVIVAEAGDSSVMYTKAESTTCHIGVVTFTAESLATNYKVFARPSYGADDTIISAIEIGNTINERIFNPKFKPFSYINDSTGEQGVAKTWISTYEFYPVSGGATITYTGKSTDANQSNTAYIAWVAEYDENKDFIKSTIFTNSSLTLDSDTKFVRFSFGHASNTNKAVCLSSFNDFGAKMTMN